MRFERLMIAAACATLLMGCRAEPPTAQPAAAARTGEAGLEIVSLTIRSGDSAHRFNVEVARTAQEQSRGLMFRESLAPNVGMLFPFVPPRPASFWMKNTLIPLDLIFVRADGSIARIADNNVPHSLEPIAVEEPVAAVLEIAGGRAAELGITEMDRVSWPGGPSL